MWDNLVEEALEKLKETLRTVFMLQYPDFIRPLLITTDAPGYAIGAVLSQGENGNDKLIACTLRVLKKGGGVVRGIRKRSSSDGARRNHVQALRVS